MANALVERNNEIRRMYLEELLTLQVIADRYCVSRQRIQEIIGPTNREMFRIRTKKKRDEAALMRERGISVKEISNHFGVTIDTAYAWTTGMGRIPTPAQLARDNIIKSLHARGVSGAEIARRLKVSPMTVSRIVRNGNNKRER